MGFVCAYWPDVWNGRIPMTFGIWMTFVEDKIKPATIICATNWSKFRSISFTRNFLYNSTVCGKDCDSCVQYRYGSVVGCGKIFCFQKGKILMLLGEERLGCRCFFWLEKTEDAYNGGKMLMLSAKKGLSDCFFWQGKDCDSADRSLCDASTKRSLCDAFGPRKYVYAFVWWKTLMLLVQGKTLMIHDGRLWCFLMEDFDASWWKTLMLLNSKIWCFSMEYFDASWWKTFMPLDGRLLCLSMEDLDGSQWKTLIVSSEERLWCCQSKERLWCFPLRKDFDALGEERLGCVWRKEGETEIGTLESRGERHLVVIVWESAVIVGACSGITLSPWQHVACILTYILCAVVMFSFVGVMVTCLCDLSQKEREMQSKSCSKVNFLCNHKGKLKNKEWVERGEKVYRWV